MADDLAQGLNLDQSLPIIKSMSSEETRKKSESNKAAEAQILSYEGQYSKPAPEFKPSEETASGFAALGSLLAASGAILGSGGKTSGLMAMNAISGMMNGYNAGRKDLYEQERQKFEESMKSWQTNRQLIKDAFDRAMKIAPTNLKLAQESLNRDLISLGQKPLAEMAQRSGPMAAASAFYKANDNTTTKLGQLSSVLGTASSRLPPEQKQYFDSLTTNQARVQFLESVAAQQKESSKESLEQKTKTAQLAEIEARTKELQLKSEQDKTKTAKEAANQKLKNETMINATGAAAGTLEAITSLGGAGTTGILPYLSSKEGLMSYLSSTTGRKMSSDESNLLSAWWTGIGTNLASLERSGAATGLVGLSEKFERLSPKDGDSEIVVAGKLADARDLIFNVMNDVKKEGVLNKDEQKALDDELSRIDKAIPFTRIDVANALTQKRKADEKKTTGEKMMESVFGTKVPPPPTAGLPANLPAGSRLIGTTPDGKQNVYETPDGKRHAFPKDAQ